MPEERHMFAPASDSETAVLIVRGPLKGLMCNVISITSEDQLFVKLAGVNGVYIQMDRGMIDELPFDD
jgi:hypothetical protein